MSTKRRAEAVALAANQTGMEVVSVLPGTIFGPGDIYRNSCGALIEMVSKWRGPRIAPPGGTSVVSMRYVVTGHILAMERGGPGRRYLLVRERV